MSYDGYVFVFVVILLLLAAAFGVLGAVLKAALVLVLAIILALVVLTVGGYYYLRHRLRRFVRNTDPRSRPYPTRGQKRPPSGPELPA